MDGRYRMRSATTNPTGKKRFAAGMNGRISQVMAITNCLIKESCLREIIGPNSPRERIPCFEGCKYEMKDCSDCDQGEQVARV